MRVKANLYCSAAIAMLVAGGSASAQEAPAGPANSTAESQLDDIVVTARKISENSQKAPAAIVSVDGGQLAKLGITDPQGLEKVLPSANLRRQGIVTQVYIRGIGTRLDLPNYAAASAFTYNGIIVPRYATFGLTQDLQRAESIAGPQGTLYGGSAAGGAINLYSARPDSNFEGYGSFEYGSYNSINATFAQNIALDDKLSFRGAFNYQSRDSFYTNSATGKSNGLNSQNNFVGKAALLYQPSSNVSIHLFYVHGEDNGKPLAIATANPFPDRNHPYNYPATGVAGNPIDSSATDLKFASNIVGANVDLDLGDNHFSLIGGLVNFDTAYNYFSGLVGSTGRPGGQFYIFDRERQASLELRWNRTIGRLQLNAGALYLRDHINFSSALIIFTSPTSSIRNVLNLTDQTNKSYAVYAQGVYSVLDTLRLTVGGRMSRDEIAATGKGANAVPINFRNGQDRGDYKVGIDFDLAPQVLVYANYQTGYIPFGYNPDVVPNVKVNQSRLYAISGGFKSRFLDNRIELNVEGFHYIYKDFQAIAFVPATGRSEVLNAQTAKIYGADISLRARITPTTRMNLGVLLERARYTRFSGVGYNYTGNQLISAPDVNLNGGLEQDILLGGAGKITLRGDARYSSSYFGNFNNFASTRQASYFKSDASATFTSGNGKWTLQAFVRNITDKAVFTTLSPTGQPALPTLPGVGGLEAPRTYGARLQVNW